MRTIELTKQFKKDYKRAMRDHRKDTNRLQLVIEMLQKDGGLPSDFKPHPLSGNWRPSWECHVQPDFLLIYDVTPSSVRLLSCGSHAELFG